MLTLFRPPVPAISHFHEFNFNPDTFENLLKSLNFYKRFLVFQKKRSTIGICCI